MRPGVCTRTTHTPILNGTFQASRRFTGTFKCGKWQYNGGFSCIFGRLKVWICKIMAYEGWSIINWCMNGVHEWDWVHERFLCPRAAPSGINNRSCTQSHSWTPNSVYLANWYRKIQLWCRPTSLIVTLTVASSLLCFCMVVARKKSTTSVFNFVNVLKLNPKS